MSAVRGGVSLILIASACRFGGPSGNPSACIQLDDAGDAQTPCSYDGSSAEVDAAEDASIDVSPLIDAPSRAPPPDASSDGDAQGDGPAGESGEAGECVPPASVPVCDPVTNTGCTLLQCDVDITQSTPTGVCVLGPGVAPVAENAPCTQTSGSTPCQPDLSCFGGSCRRICFCDSDCSVGGECCSDTYATTGFKLCGACR
jgi:hypothetical protein